eukprot:gene1693-3283_t
MCYIITPLRVKSFHSLQATDVVIQSASDPFLKETLDYSIQSFTNGVQSKFIGFLIGNFLAGIVVKLIADGLQYASNKYKAKAEEVTLPPPKPFTINPSSWAVLALCVFIDLVGDSSFVIPGLGELEDVVWAPISAFALNQIFGSSTVSTIDFVKEILPGLDVIPVASLAWLLQNYYPQNPVTNILGIRPAPEVNFSAGNSTTTTKS